MSRSLRRHIVAGVFAFGLVAGAAAPSIAAVDELVARALQLNQANQSEAAYQALAPHADARASDPDFAYALGLAALDSGRPAEAIVALQRALALQPQNSAARAELARAYALAGDPDTARREFQTVMHDPTLPDPVRQRFTRVLGELDRAVDGGGRDLTGFVEFGGGYDSNINSATDATTLLVPLFAGLGPAALSATARELDDGYAQVDAGVSLVQGLDRQTRVFVSALGGLKENLQDELFDRATLVGSAGLSRSFANRSVAALSLQHQSLWVGGDHFRAANGVGAQWTFPTAQRTAVALSAQYFDIEHPDDPLRDAERGALGASYVWRTGAATLQAGRERTNDAAADHLSHGFAAVSVSIEAPLGPSFSLLAHLGGEARDYEAADPLFLVSREDRQLDAGLGFRVRLSERLSLRTMVSHTQVDSNVALYEHDRLNAALSLRAEF